MKTIIYKNGDPLTKRHAVKPVRFLIWPYVVQFLNMLAYLMKAGMETFAPIVLPGVGERGVGLDVNV